MDYIHLQEYDSNNNLIKTTLIKYHEELSSMNPFLLQKETSYVLLTQNTGQSGIFLRGDSVEVFLPAKYGYLYKSYITFK